MWERPEFREVREKRDSDPTTPSYETARPLVELALYNKPMSQTQHEYLNRFMASSVCKEFFCRLGLSFKDISRCWLEGPVTDDQCVRCVNYHNAAQIPWRVQRSAPDGTPLRLVIVADDGVSRPRWEIAKPDVLGLTGTYILGVMIHPRVKPEQIYTLCLPGLSKNFRNDCNHNCLKCPGLAYYDSAHKFAVAGNGTTLIEHFPPAVATAIEDIIARRRNQWKELGIESPDVGATRLGPDDDPPVGAGR